jgi:type I restriction enzyme, S subunit
VTFTDAKPLGLLLRRPPKYGINAAAVPFAPGLPTYIRITDIDDSGRFTPNPKVGVANPRWRDYLMGLGELVFARTGASVGKSYLYDPRDGELVYAGFLIDIAPDPKVLNPKYLALFVQSKDYWDWVARTSVRSGQPGVNGREYAQLPVPLPDIAVQNAIAAVMTDVDDLINTMDQLITKKRAIRQGLMQQLVTGSTRLPGFSETWKAFRLGAVGSCLRGVSYDPSVDLSSSDGSQTFRLLRSNNIQDGLIIDRDFQYVNKRRVALQQVLQAGDIVICMSNGSRSLVGKSAYFDLPDRGFGYTFGAFMGAFRTTHGASDPRFLCQLLKTRAFRTWLDVILAGSSINNLRPRDIEAFETLAPSAAEQTAIADVLEGVDEEIEGLRRQLAKTKAIKLGMMQQLLCRRTRLSVEKVSA